MFNNLSFIIVLVLVSVIVSVCSLGIVVAVKIQKKSKKKYNDVIDIINKNKDATFEVKNSLTKDEINTIDSTVDVDSLMIELYSKYLLFENKVKDFDENLDDVLTGFLKDFYINKIQNFKQKGYKDIKDSIDLVGYSIEEYEKERLKFRVIMNCLDYKEINGQIVSGSNVHKVEEIISLTYEKVNDNWLISGYEKIYEKKLSM